MHIKLYTGKNNEIRKVMENVVIKGTADNIYSPNFSMAGKTGTAKKYISRRKNEKGETIAGHYSNKHYVASFAGFFPADRPKYTCIVVIHDPKKEKGYYGATVAAPVFKEIAQKIYTTNLETSLQAFIHQPLSSFSYLRLASLPFHQLSMLPCLLYFS